MSALDKDHLIWLDLEMTGLAPDRDQILEIATVITNSDLEILAEGPVIPIHQPQAVLDGMDEWNQRHHGASGLIERVRKSPWTTAAAERETLNFLAQWVPPGASPLCGNSICQDRRFLARLMPELERYFHYRNLDVSSLKILAQRWKPEVAQAFQKQTAHQALADVRESIAGLAHYRAHLFRS